MDLDLKELFAAYTVEADECLTSMEHGLLQLEQQPDDSEFLDLVFRAAHTMKGNSASLGFGELATFAHECEDLLDRLRQRELRADAELITLLLAAVDAMKDWLPSLQLEGENAMTAAAHDVYERLCDYGRRGASAASASAGVASSAETATQSKADAALTATIRVQTGRMDTLLNLSGEMAIATARMRQRAATADQLEAVEEVERILRDLHDTVMRCRMVAIGPTFRRHRRTVRDLAAAKGKQVRLVLEGEDVEVDVSVIEALADPLIHMIRNALDHGIETPAVRAAAGKPPAGTIRLRAFHERATIVVEVIDDGSGIHRSKLRDRALAMGLPAQSLTENELLMLIFEPGFSTAETVTETSGRGVGMDVVRRNVERVRGRIGVESVEGQGTTISMRLPLTLAVIPGFVVGTAGEQFVIPMSSVDECLVRPPAIEGDAATGIMHVRGEGVPYVRLRDYLGFGGLFGGQEVVVLVDHRDGRAGLIVDEVIGESQIVIKPLTGMLRNVPGITGTAVMGNGAVAMVLDSAAIFREFERSSAA